LIPAWSILEGCNQLSSLYLSRLIEGTVNTLTVWIAISFGAKLWTAAISSAGVLVWNLGFLGWRYKEFFQPFWHQISTGSRVNWRHEIWPIQWRIAISWISGYFCFSLFTPVLFHYQGPIIAGQYGMTSSFMIAASSISGMWIATRFPQFGALIAKKKYEELDRLCFRAIAYSTTILSMGALAIWAGTYGLYFLGHPLAKRLLPPLPTGLFLLTGVLVQGSSPLSLYIRAHKKEPFLVLSIVSGILVALSTWFLGSHFGVIAMAAGYLAVMACVVFPWNLILWTRYRTEWHSTNYIC